MAGQNHNILWEIIFWTIDYEAETVSTSASIYLKVNVMFRNKRSQAKGVYYVFLYKQQLDSIYTQVAIHRFTLVPLHTVAHGCWAPTPSAPLFFS